MENFKIVNRNTKATYFLNENQKDRFFGNIKGTHQYVETSKQLNSYYKDGEYQYDIYNLTQEKAIRTDKALDALAYLGVLAASVISTLIYIQTYC